MTAPNVYNPHDSPPPDRVPDPPADSGDQANEPDGRVSQPLIVVRSSVDLPALHRNPIGPGRTRVVLRLPQLPQDQSTVWEKKLNLRFSECGCTAGTGLALLAALAATVWQFACADWRPPSWPGFLFRAIVAMLLAGIAGKFIAIEIARCHIRILAGRIQKYLA